MTFLIFWSYCGYPMALFLLSIFSSQKNKKDFIKTYPQVSVIIPCLNEEAIVAKKIENTIKLNYPKDKLEIIFVDGGSTDKTVPIIKEAISGMQNVRLHEINQQGKINQINSILPNLKSEIVINTDVDAILAEGVILELIKIFNCDSDVAVVGAHVIPGAAFELEEQFWSEQNRLRFLESEVHSSSIVAAPCYAFKRELLAVFPKDCIADDIYISYLANVEGKKSKYAESALVYETRIPQTLEEFLRHKFRKGNAYMIELLRFFYQLPRMQPYWKMIFLTKFLHVVVMPWIIPFFILCSISMLLSTAGLAKVVVFSYVFLAVSLLITHCLMAHGRKDLNAKKRSLSKTMTCFLIMNFILFLNGISYSFYRQTSNYQKLKNNRHCNNEHNKT